MEKNGKVSAALASLAVRGHELLAFRSLHHLKAQP